MINFEAPIVTINNKKYEIHLAKINKTYLGIEDHGIFSFNIDFEWGSGGQGTGFLGLNTWDENKRLISHPASNILLEKILKIVGVYYWEELKGRSVYLIKETGWGGFIKGLRSLFSEDYVIFEELFNEYK